MKPHADYDKTGNHIRELYRNEARIREALLRRNEALVMPSKVEVVLSFAIMAGMITLFLLGSH